MVLHEAIEKYREKHQGPVLERSSAIFRRLTSGSFESLRVDVDEKGRNTLVGIRNGGKESVAVENMSQGTADQLYLAIRIAGIENYLDQGESFPFIIDDILIQFDDERALAALEVLADLSRKTQVIFFTHHRHIMEMSQRNLPENILYTHEIQSRTRI